MQGRDFAVIDAVRLAIGCRLEIRCPTATPLLALVHPHASLLPDLCSPEQVLLQPDRTYELLSDAAGNRWSRLIASAGVTTFTYAARIERPDSTDPVVANATACAVQALPVDTYPLLNPSPYCDTAALMAFAWSTFAGAPAGGGRVQAICAWFEVFLESRWHVFDARHNIPRCGRVLIARGRDAADVPFLRSFGAHELVGFAVTTEIVAPEPELPAQAAAGEQHALSVPLG
jgi:hypothetical protein